MTAGAQEYAALTAVAVVVAVTVLVASYGTRLSRTTGDFYVASRSVRPWWNASAIGGEYLSAASFLGVAGLVLLEGADALWFPIGYTVGYLLLLGFVAAPLRRSGAYTLPDFAEVRLGSARARRASALVVVVVGWLYLLPQFTAAGLVWSTATGLPREVGTLVVAAVVAGAVAGGGMRSITIVQAVQYWLKLTAIAVPACVLLALWGRQGAPVPPVPAGWGVPSAAPADLYGTYSLLLALLLGTMGLPHVLTRFYTNPDGTDARRTTRTVIGLLGLFYVWPPVYALLAWLWAPGLAAPGRAETVVVDLPALALPGAAGVVLSAVALGGAFAAFLSTASGLTVAVSGVLARDLVPGRLAGRLTGQGSGDPAAGRAGVARFRLATLGALVVPVGVALVGVDVPLAATVGLAFALAASTFAPLLLLGIWWDGLRTGPALLGMGAGGAAAALAAVLTLTGVSARAPVWLGEALAQPAAWTVPLAAAVMVAGSLAVRARERRRDAPAEERPGLAPALLHRPERAGSNGSGGAARRGAPTARR
ncbi:cation acetate symporter [Aquipuribacter nitratireducens]|uniref:Cation acetate symporter n=1 Tax=Aquipuribacter nitratireducens TaxID=650104 RepID=A0ABW0GRM8_9MICO